MTTTVNRQELVAALRALRVAVGNNPTLPILANVAIESAGDQLQLTSTNLDVFIRRQVAFSGDPLPNITVPAKALGDFAAGFSGEKVTLTLDDKKLRLSSGKQRATLSTIDFDEFPAFPSLESATSFTLSREQFDAIAKKVAPFASPDINSRPILTGVHVMGDGSSIRFASADNYRIGVLTIEHAATLEVVIPATTITGVTKVVEGEDINVTVASNGVMFSSSEGILTSRLIEGQFPNIEPVMPTTFTGTLLIDPEDLGDAAKLAAMASEAGVVKFELTDDGLRVHAKDYDHEFDTTLDTTLSSEAPESLTFALNTKYVVSAASAFSDSTQIEVGYNGPLAPVAFHDPNDAGYRVVVMPVRTPGS